MGTIDWQKIYDATSTDNRPTPGYLFHEITHDISHALPSEIPPVVTYLADCVDGDHAHVKLKALFVIKHLAYRIPPFCRMMAERTQSVEEAVSFTGPPSPLYGDEPYRLVREAAQGAMQALTSGEFYHEQYRTMSQRIVGFGNYQPGAETVLRDGSIDVYPEITVSTIAAGTFDVLRAGLGAVVGGVKGVFSSGTWGPVGAAEGFPDENELEAEDPPREEDVAYEDDDVTIDKDDVYRPSTGDYIPPPLPPQPAATEMMPVEEEQAAIEPEELLDLSEDDERLQVRSLLDDELDHAPGVSLLEVLEAHSRACKDLSSFDPMTEVAPKEPVLVSGPDS
mmetsp:Transcript_60680/g.112578  ORF Transcript_60680/g.112578 Transcript_60680/m.112578 type:complete len:337 (+) Transcript_60680:85-1095(+)